jgi:hypothetical protein
MATFHEWLQRLQACIDGDGEYMNKHPLIQKTSVELQREAEMLRRGLNTLYVKTEGM